MTSPETNAARNRVTLAQQELERAQAALAFAQAGEYSQALSLIGNIVLDAAQRVPGATLVDGRQILQTATANILVVLQSAGFVQPSAADALEAQADPAQAAGAPTEPIEHAAEPEPAPAA